MATRHGSRSDQVVLGGRKVQVRRPRARIVCAREAGRAGADGRGTILSPEDVPG